MLKEMCLATGLLVSPESVCVCMQTVATGVKCRLRLILNLLKETCLAAGLLTSPESVCVCMQTVQQG